MEDNRGVVLTYVEGAMCNSSSGTRWNTTILLICNRNLHVVCGGREGEEGREKRGRGERKGGEGKERGKEREREVGGSRCV